MPFRSFQSATDVVDLSGCSRMIVLEKEESESVPKGRQIGTIPELSIVLRYDMLTWAAHQHHQHSGCFKHLRRWKKWVSLQLTLLTTQYLCWVGSCWREVHWTWLRSSNSCSSRSHVAKDECDVFGRLDFQWKYYSDFIILFDIFWDIHDINISCKGKWE